MSTNDAIHTFLCVSSSAEDSESRHSGRDVNDATEPSVSPNPSSVHSAHPDDEDGQSQSKMSGNQIGTVILYGVPIVSLMMDNKERLCLAQISSTLLKDYSYNEIHNRRVALGITCAQCTPVQLELLRRAGAMPVTSRRCGMITRREAERLCKSFLGDQSPPKLPENFAFDVSHQCAWGCRGAFLPSRYNSSRAKCIKCFLCNLFFSPNKFIFHSHRLPDSKYVQPDAANFNSWRRHIHLTGTPPDEIAFAWEDVKAMFNGGSRKRTSSAAVPASSSPASPSVLPSASPKGPPPAESTSRPLGIPTVALSVKKSHKKIKMEQRPLVRVDDSPSPDEEVPAAFEPPAASASPRPTMQPANSLLYRFHATAPSVASSGPKVTPVSAAETPLADYQSLWNSSRFWAPYLNLNLNPLPVIPPYLYNYGYTFIKSDLSAGPSSPAAPNPTWQYRHPRLPPLPTLAPAAANPSPVLLDLKASAAHHRLDDDAESYVDVETTDSAL